MAAKRAWYRSNDYKQALEKKELGDRSTVEVVESEGILTLSRTYPWGFTQKIVYRLRPDGSTEYIDIGPGPESPVKHLSAEERTKRFEEDLANGEVRITARGPIPGAGLGVTYDSATRKHYTQSSQFEEEFDKMKLARAMTSDHSTMHRSAPPPAYSGGVGQVEGFAVDSLNAVPPLPRRG